MIRVGDWFELTQELKYKLTGDSNINIYHSWFYHSWFDVPTGAFCKVLRIYRTTAVSNFYQGTGPHPGIAISFRREGSDNPIRWVMYLRENKELELFQPTNDPAVLAMFELGDF